MSSFFADSHLGTSRGFGDFLNSFGALTQPAGFLAFRLRLASRFGYPEEGSSREGSRATRGWTPKDAMDLAVEYVEVDFEYGESQGAQERRGFPCG